VRLCLKALSIIQTSIASERAYPRRGRFIARLCHSERRPCLCSASVFIADERIERINLSIPDFLDESSHRVPDIAGTIVSGNLAGFPTRWVWLT
jgi:hypothetical protein